jgi:hypothetical protein
VIRTVTRRALFGIIGAAALIAAVPAAAQPVHLQIKPHVGDTFSVRLDQKVEMTGVPSGCATGYSGSRKTSPEPPTRSCAENTRQMTSEMEVFSKAIVRRVTSRGSVVLAVTDSIRSAVSNGAARTRPRRVTSPKSTIEIRIAPDGGAEVVDADASPELRAIFGQMPATLSREAVEVGDTWQKQMRIPLSMEAGASGTVRATFRLDSLERNGDIAFISMKGTLSHDHPDSELDGWISGTIQLDRRRAWITDTRAVIDVESTVKQATGLPMRVRTKITQTLKARAVR